MYRIACLLIILLSFLDGMSQEVAPDTTVNLETFTVNASRSMWSSTGQVKVAIGQDETRLNPGASLAEIISQVTPVNVTSYGPGTLATLHLRGSSASQAGLVWNGVRLSPPNLGYVDLSLVPVELFDDISIVYGGAGPVYGSGFIGGCLQLDNLPSFGVKYHELGASASFGSFKTGRAMMRYEQSAESFHHSTALNFRSTENDFGYTNLSGDRSRLDHAGMSQFGGMENIAIRLKGDQYIQAVAWLQYTDRDIPPTLTEAISAANQVDRSIRSFVMWKDRNPRSGLEAKVSYFNEFTRYKDTITKVYSVIRSQTMAGSFGSDLKLSDRSRLYVGASYHHDRADLTAYDYPRSENKTAGFLSYHADFPRIQWELTLNLREELVDDHWSPFLFSFGAQGTIYADIKARLNFSRNYRSPTLNEKYWQPGGDPGLLPESSWNQEAGLSWESVSGTFRGPFDLTAFSSVVENWILWVPQGMLWGVQNRQKVWSRGIEVSGRHEVQWGRFKMDARAAYALTRSTNEKKVSSFDESYHKQLIYTPCHRLMVRISVTYKTFGLSFRNTYSSRIYTTSDNLGSLPGYDLVDGIITKDFDLGSHRFQVQLNINNLFNQEYQSVPYRPMPGINILATLSYRFEKSQTSNP